jgi:hypothetical protein
MMAGLTNKTAVWVLVKANPPRLRRRSVSPPVCCAKMITLFRVLPLK